MSHHLVPVETAADILLVNRGTLLDSLPRHRELGEPLPPTTGHAHLLVAMGTDHRKELVIPNEFAGLPPSAGWYLRACEFEVACAVTFVVDEGARVRALFPAVRAVALLGRVDWGRRKQIEED